MFTDADVMIDYDAQIEQLVRTNKLGNLFRPGLLNKKTKSKAASRGLPDHEHDTQEGFGRRHCRA